MKKLMVTIMIAGFVFGQGFDYVGTSKCGMCHKSDKKGAQLKVWEAGSHAGAFETLKSDESTKIAEKLGLKVPAYEAGECLVCHTTGYGAGGYEVKDAAFWEEKTEKGKPTKAAKRMSGLQSVSCEACHGAGDKYKSSKVMKEIYAGTLDGKTVGLIVPDEAVCKTCHNEKSPTFKSFVFAEKVKEIAHPYPPEMTE